MEFNQLNTPCYVIDRDKFQSNCYEVMNNFTRHWGENMHFGYSIKTNNNATLMKLAGELGWFPEAVSVDELNHAKELGFKYPDIIFNGPIKDELLLEACDNGAIVNLDNFEDIYKLIENKATLNMNMLRLGIRVNFDLESLCPGETTMGEEVGRFGFCYENGDIKRAVELLEANNIPIAGIHMHTSTTSRSARVFNELAKMVCRISREFNLKFSFIDMGGGYFGGQKVAGKPSMEEYAVAICDTLKECFNPESTTLILEPGASVIATSVEYISRVENIRDIRGKRVVTLDGTLLHINPFMYKRTPVYDILNTSDEVESEQLLCGCTCMENDRFVRLLDTKQITKDSIVVFKNAGAYSMGFNSHFIVNPPAVYLKNNEEYSKTGCSQKEC